LKHSLPRISRHLNLLVVSKTLEGAADYFGWMVRFVGLYMPASSSIRTQQRLGWHPTQRGLMADLEQGYYFGKLDWTSKKRSATNLLQGASFWG